MKRMLLLLPVLLLFCLVKAQTESPTPGNKMKWKPKWVYLSGENLYPAKPFSGVGKLFTKYFHPGINIGADILRWNEKKIDFETQKQQLVQGINLGYFYHAQVQQAIHLNSYLNYRYGIKLSKEDKHYALGFSGRFGLGYFHSVPLQQRFRLNDEGEYERIRGLGRPQLDVTLGLGVDYTDHPSGNRVFLRYNSRIQMPFVKSYVPLLPYSIVEVGYAFCVFCKPVTGVIF